MVEMVWHENVPSIAAGPIPKGLSGPDRIAFTKSRRAAQDLLKSLFPDEE